MKFCFKVFSGGLVAITLTSCNGPAGQGILNRSIGVPIRMIQALSRTAGMTASAETPSTETEAVAQRGKLVEQQGPLGQPLSERPMAKVAQR